MMALDAPVFFPIVFGLFAALLLFALVDMWLTETRVEIGSGMLRFTKRMLASGKRLDFRSDEVASIKPKRGMQAGNKLYYRIELTTRAGKSHVLASQIGDQRLARRLIEDFEAGHGRRLSDAGDAAPRGRPHRRCRALARRREPPNSTGAT